MMNKLMKKIAVAMAIATMTITATSAVTFANDGQGIENMDVRVYDCNKTMYVTSDTANVRTAPAEGYRILYTLNAGDVIYVDGYTSNGWYRFITNDPIYGGETSGYVCGDLLAKCGGHQDDETSYTVNVQSGYLALRTTPNWTDDDSNVIEEMYNGQRFTPTDKCGQYWYGYSNSTGNYGYVNADYLI